MTEKTLVNGLEDKLSGVLRPIAPRREFVHGLGSHIHRLQQTVQQAGAGTWKFILLMLAGILSLGLLLALVGRALYNLLSVQRPRSERA
ncbi:MAG: hypothetical protein AB1531_06225 [Chloroflexota bacterium]